MLLKNEKIYTIPELQQTLWTNNEANTNITIQTTCMHKTKVNQNEKIEKRISVCSEFMNAYKNTPNVVMEDLFTQHQLGLQIIIFCHHILLISK